MDQSKLAALIEALVPLGIKLAETIHPLSDSGHQKLATATTMVQVGLGLAASAGAVPAGAANAFDIAGQINEAVAAANRKGGVEKL